MAPEAWFGVDRRARPLVVAGTVLGLGLGGFFDGIVFHQILQTHQMATSHPDPSIAEDMALNVTLDGLFHAGTYLLTVAGVILVWRAWRLPDVPPSGRTLLGSALVGWGTFNLVEGAIDHHLLAIHHVWPAGPGGQLVWDVAFLVWGVLMLVIGAAVIRTDPAVDPGGPRSRAPPDAQESEEAVRRRN